jgi:signal transduction histidine kinase
MAHVPHSISGAISLAEIDITAQLAQRPACPPDYAAENRALVHLAHEMVTHPAHILQTLVDTALVLCRADTAGLSLLESDNEESDNEKAVFRWEAVAGVFADRLNHTMPRDASPCGTTIDRNAPQLMYMPERFFPTLTAVPPVVEALLIPFQVAETPIGTLWVVAHDERRKFDREDVRLVQTLGQFAAAAWQVWQAQITLARRVEKRTAAWHRARAERRRLQQEVQQAAPFAKLGRLAANVSHELRNPLGAVVLDVDLLEEELREQAPASVMLVEDTLTDIRTHLARLEDLVQDYLSLARVGSSELAPQHLGTLVQDWATEWAPLAAARGVTLACEGLEVVGQVAVYPTTLRRALLNLVQNALDAMPQGGQLTLRGHRSGATVQLDVCDTGSGISPEHCARIFEPLYTTKPEGTGLGLCIVQEVMAAHGGQMTVQSIVGHGSTFTITLPLMASEDTT